MEILIDNKLAALKQGTSFEFVLENRLFSGSDGYTLSITFPLRGCAQNLKIFGNIHRADVVDGKVVFDCQIRDKAFVKHGSITITEINDSEVKTQFLEGRSEANFDTTFDDIYINELNLGAPKSTSKSAVTPSAAWGNGWRNLSFVALPWVNNESGNIQNCTKFANGAYSWHDDTTGLSWQPYLIYIVKKICEAVGYDYDFTAWEEKEEHRFLLVCNTLPYAWGMPGFANALPHWTVAEFFEKLELFLDAEFDIDHRAKYIGFHYTQPYLAALKTEVIEDIIDEHTVEVAVEEEHCEYREEKNLVYAECDHEMWKFYSCDWFIRPRKDSAVVFNKLTELLSATKNFATWDGRSYRGSNFNSLFYVKDLDVYFVIRAVEKCLVEERKDMPNIYSYTCVLQPVNLFGGRIVDDSEDADVEEVEFVPAWTDWTDSTYGRCLFLSFSGFDDSGASGETYVGGNRDAMKDFKEHVDSTFYNSWQVQTLEAGEKEKKSEFYDKIYIGWWDGAIAKRGKLPYPYTDDIDIFEDWSGYFRPHTSLRLNNKIIRTAPAIDTHRNTTFKFLCNKLPNPRAVFLIRGKRFICEKLTATFTESGMSQLVKGIFWAVKD